jgi:DNA modification methylase
MSYLLFQADARRLPIESGTVQCAVTSPPYFGLRDYGTAKWDGGDPACNHLSDATGGNPAQGPNIGNNNNNGPPFKDICGKCAAKRIDDQIGIEKTPQEYIDNIRAVFRELWRVLRDDGVVFLNLGDSYAGGGGYSPNSPSNLLNSKQSKNRGSKKGTSVPNGLKPKDQILIPHRVVIALQADGWYVRDTIIWDKRNPMTSSVRDRTTTAHEYIFLLTKSARYFYDAFAISEPAATKPHRCHGKKLDATRRDHNRLDEIWGTERRNKRSVWTIPLKSYKGAHFATFPIQLPTLCIQAGSSQKGCCPHCRAPWERIIEKKRVRTRPGTDTKIARTTVIESGNRDAGRHVSLSQEAGWQPTCKCSPHEPIPCLILDPFGGAQTTGVAAILLGRSYMGVDLNPKYLALGKKRLDRQISKMATPLFNLPNLTPEKAQQKSPAVVAGRQFGMFD